VNDDSSRDLAGFPRFYSAAYSRLADYTRGYQSGGNMSNAQHIFLSNLMVLAQTGQIRKTIDVPFGNAIDRAVDYGEILTGMTSHTILLVALKHVFDAGDFERMSAAQVKVLVIMGIQAAKPFEMKLGPLFLLR
jgi:hypothetical protein